MIFPEFPKEKNILRKIYTILRLPGFWLIFVLLIILSLPHYREAFQHPAFLNELMQQLNVNRHAFERILYLVPIIISGFVFGWKGVIGVSLCALALMLPRVFLLSRDFGDALFETFSIFIVGNVVAISFVLLRREREHRIQLSVLDKIARAVSQSLNLAEILNASIESVMSIMNIDAAYISLFNEENNTLRVASYKGVSDEYVRSLDKLQINDNINGTVVITGNAQYIEDVAKDIRFLKINIYVNEDLRSYFIVPLKSKNKMMGTLTIATKNKYSFRSEEMDTAIAIGNEIGVAIENAKMYQKEKQIAERLRVSEEKYRNLFENAHDAIWLNDLGDNIIAANKACSRLTGYTPIELYLIRASELFTPESLEVVNKIRQELAEYREEGIIYEVEIIKKDKNKVPVQLSSSLLLNDGKPWAFQHIARDITEEKRMQENLRFYLQQVTKAQEEERKRIARELHDDTIQSLIVLARKIDDITYNDSRIPEDKKKQIESIREELNIIMSDIRRLSQDLRPPTLDRLGLIPALEWLASSIESISNISIKFKVEGNIKRLPAEVELILYRIVQEALRNVWKHSNASEAEVMVSYKEPNIRIVVKDNGKGLDFDYQPEELARYGKLGLAGIKERTRLLGGNLQIVSQKGSGTTLIIDAPI